MIDEGGVAIGEQSLFATLRGKKPVVAGVAITTIAGASKSAVVLFGDGTHVLAPYGTYAKQVLHAKSAAVVYEDEPGIADAQAWINALKTVGIPVKAVATRRRRPT